MYYNATTNMQAPQSIYSGSPVSNNALAEAQAMADPRFNMKEYDRAGISRGRGTQAAAGIKAAQALAEGVARAYTTPTQEAVEDANAQRDFQQQREQFGQALTGLQQQNDYANALASLQRQQNAMQFQGNLLNGLLGTVGAGFGSGGGVGGGWLDNFLGY